MERRWLIVFGAVLLAGCGATAPADLEAGGDPVVTAGSVPSSVATTVGTEAPGTTVAEVAVAAVDEPVSTVTTAAPITTVAPTTTAAPTTTQAPTTTAAPPTTAARRMPVPYSGGLSGDAQVARAAIERVLGPLALDANLMAAAAGNAGAADLSDWAATGRGSRTCQGVDYQTVEVVTTSCATGVGVAGATHLGLAVGGSERERSVTIVLRAWV